MRRCVEGAVAADAEVDARLFDRPDLFRHQCAAAVGGFSPTRADVRLGGAARLEGGKSRADRPARNR